MNQRSINFSRAIFALLLCVGVIMMSCEEIQPIAVTSVSLNSTSMELVEGTTQTLVATVSPSNAENQKVIWSSSNSTVASVANGVVTAIKAGTATITVKTDDGAKTATCNVTVVAKEIPVTSVSLDQTEIELMEGDELSLTATVKPENATNKNVSWSSSNSSVASVANGVVTAIKEGNATIIVKTDDGAKTATCNVTVLHDSSNDAIVFADEVMKEMCVTAFDTSGDGELSYAEAAAVTDLSKMELTDKSFKSFDEFQYFTSVTTIPCMYFESCSSLKSINIPESVTTIDDAAFRFCSSLQSINIPNSVISIGGSAFQLCSSLQSINIPESVTNIGGYAFQACSTLQSINIPESVTTINERVFDDCSSLKSINIPESVTTIKYEAFRFCSSLQSINIPESVTTIDDATFRFCSSLQSINIPESVTNIGIYAFSDCSSLQSINIPESVTSINNYVFCNCSSLQSINIPESVTNIGYYAFKGCSSLQSITLSEYVTSISGSAFRDCSNLKKIYVKSQNIPKLVIDNNNRYNSFDGNAPSRKIYVPYKVRDTYKKAKGWKEYAADIVGYDYENNKVVE